MMPANTVYLVGGCADTRATLAELWPCGACTAPPDFGRDGAWVPFSHSRDKMLPSAGGLFSYHAAGCSDIELHVGRTLLARNRVHLAMRLTQLLGPLGPLDEAQPLPHLPPLTPPSLAPSHRSALRVRRGPSACAGCSRLARRRLSRQARRHTPTTTPSSTWRDG